MLQFTVDKELCTKCGLCISDCVTSVISKDENGFPQISEDVEQNCLKCQHCLAICPVSAVSIFGKTPSDSHSLTRDSFPSFEKMTDFVRGRRSIRHYKNENVNPDLLKTILSTLANAPTGANAMELTFHLIDNKDVMLRFEEKVIDLLLEAERSGRLEEAYPFVHMIAAQPREVISSHLFRSAPHLLVVSANPNSPCAREDIAISLAYFELLAQSAGLGTVWWGFFAALESVIPEMKSIIGIPKDDFCYAMLFGVPSVKYPRTVQRDDVAVIKRIDI